MLPSPNRTRSSAFPRRTGWRSWAARRRLADRCWWRLALSNPPARYYDALTRAHLAILAPRMPRKTSIHKALSRFLEALPQPVYVLDGERRFVYGNAAFSA